MRLKRDIARILRTFFGKINKKALIPVVIPVDEEKILKNKVALIVGGSGGIGFEIAKSFVESGAKVILAARNEEKLKSCRNQLGEKSSAYICIDLENVESFNEKVIQSVNRFGRLDILVNAAGTHTANMDFWTINPAEYDRVINTNLRGVYFFTREVADYMRKRGIKGHILNIVSSTSEEPAWSPYRISKKSFKSMSEGLAKTLISFGIKVNAIAPNSVATELNGYKSGDSINSDDCIPKRLVMPEEIATYAKLLVSDLGDIAVGSTLFLSGGRGVFDFR